MIKNFLFSHQIPGRATGLYVSNRLCDFCSQSKLSRNRCIPICSDGAASMTGKHSEVVAVVAVYLTPSEGWGMVENHGAPEARQLSRVWTKGRRETESLKSERCKESVAGQCRMR